MEQLKRFLFASLCSILLSYLIFAIGIRNDLLAGAHLYSTAWVFRWSIILAALTGLLAAALSNKLPTWKLFLIALVTAAIFSFLIPRIMFHHFTGTWRLGVIELDFEIQTALCWVAATVSALMIAFARRVSALTATVFLSTIAVAVPAPAYRYLMHDQELTVAFVVPETSAPGAPPPQILNGSENKIDTTQLINDVRSLLKRSGINEEYRLSFASRAGRGKPALQVIVINRQVTRHAELPQPKATQVLYIQKGDAWERIPSDAPVLNRSVQLREHEKYISYFSIPDARGVSLGGRIEPD